MGRLAFVGGTGAQGLGLALRFARQLDRQSGAAGQFLEQEDRAVLQLALVAAEIDRGATLCAWRGEIEQHALAEARQFRDAAIAAGAAEMGDC